MREYKVKYDGIVVGTVELNVSGLYCTIRCICKDVGKIMRLVDKGDTGDVSIGICAPVRGGIGLERRIPVKYIDGIHHEFVLLPTDESEKCFYPLNEKLPTDILKQIEKCSYLVQNHQPGVIISFRQGCIYCCQSE